MTWLWVLAGPNGSGKSTLARSGALRLWHADFPETAQSPDDIARLLPPMVPGATPLAYLRAAQMLSDSIVELAVEEGRGMLVETVGSSDKFFPVIDRAKRLGQRFGFVYVTVEFGDLNLARVAHRAGLGGHDVPRDRILDRRQRSIRNFPEFARRADAGMVIDNSLANASTHAGRPRVLAEKREDAPWRVVDGGVAPYLTHWLSAGQ